MSPVDLQNSSLTRFRMVVRFANVDLLAGGLPAIAQ
jgi:hypothetical protein